MHPKYKALLEFFKDYRRVGVSMSGGTCSNLVAIAAAEALGPKNVNGINLVSEFFAWSDNESCIRLCSKLGMRLHRPSVSMLNYQPIARNDADRCFFCKRILVYFLNEVARDNNLPILLDGSSTSSSHVYLEGERQMEDYKLLSPLRSVGITAADAAVILRDIGWREYIRPELSCLSTRVAYGEPITLKKLRLIRSAEFQLEQMGFDFNRVRVKGTKAVVEVEPDRVEELKKEREELNEELQGMGFAEVEIAEEGYKKRGYCMGD